MGPAASAAQQAQRAAGRDLETHGLERHGLERHGLDDLLAPNCILLVE
jgi:hypothetical protein